MTCGFFVEREWLRKANISDRHLTGCLKFWLDLRKYFFDLKYEMRSYADLHFKKGHKRQILKGDKLKNLQKTFLLEKNLRFVFCFFEVRAHVFKELHVLGEPRRLLNYASLLKVSFLLNHQQLTKIFFGPIIIAIGASQRNLGSY